MEESDKEKIGKQLVKDTEIEQILEYFDVGDILFQINDLDIVERIDVTMLKETSQTTIKLSNYAKLYDILIAKDNFWRQLNEIVDFSFVYEELKDKYSSTMGRKAEDVVRMFKYLLLKSYFKLSDRGLVERTQTDLLFKYFSEVSLVFILLFLDMLSLKISFWCHPVSALNFNSLLF